MAYALPPQASLFTFEGAPPLASLSEVVFEQQAPAEISISLVAGHLDQTLPAWASEHTRIDFAFLDANHRFEPTLRYFDTLLPLCHEDTCLVFDDIHWSAEMEAAWETICQHESVTLSLDLFNIGVVFFRRKQPKQHFVLWHTSF
jgi:predicted O-methyltransferase YrrM